MTSTYLSEADRVRLYALRRYATFGQMARVLGLHPNSLSRVLHGRYPLRLSLLARIRALTPEQLQPERNHL